MKKIGRVLLAALMITTAAIGPAAGGSPAAGDPPPVEVELVGRWPYGPARAITAIETGGKTYAFLGAGAGVLVWISPTRPAQRR